MSSHPINRRDIPIFHCLKKHAAGSIYNCTAKDIDVTTSLRRTSTVVNGTLLEQLQL
jgi:hypothetical protein